MEANNMAWRYFTEEQQNQLRASPYVIKVYSGMVFFSAEFKEKLWHSIQSGKELHEAITEMGIDPEILGKPRIQGIKVSIQNDVIAGRGFRDLRTKGGQPRIFTDPDAKIKHLEQQIAYKDQEIEFPKKIVSLDKGAKEVSES